MASLTNAASFKRVRHLVDKALTLAKTGTWSRERSGAANAGGLPQCGVRPAAAAAHPC